MACIDKDLAGVDEMDIAYLVAIVALAVSLWAAIRGCERLGRQR
jgi:hypothetical protein